MLITRSVPDLTTRMNAGTLAMPIAIIAEVTEEPNSVAKMSAMQQRRERQPARR